MMIQNWDVFSGSVINCWTASIPQCDGFLYSKNCRTEGILDLIYYIEGHDIVDTGKQKFVCKADSIRISPPIDYSETETAIRSVADGRYIAFHYVCEQPFCDCTTVFDAQGIPKLKELFIKAQNIWLHRHENYYIQTTTIFYEILNELYKLSSSETAENDVFAKLNPAVDYIHDHYFDGDFSYDTLHELCGINRSYFNRIFQNKFKTQPTKYVNSLRMNLATDMLLSTNLSINEIAKKCGYNSTCYFNRIFKKTFGVAPTNYTWNIRKTDA